MQTGLQNQSWRGQHPLSVPLSARALIEDDTGDEDDLDAIRDFLDQPSPVREIATELGMTALSDTVAVLNIPLRQPINALNVNGRVYTHVRLTLINSVDKGYVTVKARLARQEGDGWKMWRRRKAIFVHEGALERGAAEIRYWIGSLQRRSLEDVKSYDRAFSRRGFSRY